MENTIQTVKKQVDENNELVGYLVDGTKSVPLADGNRDYKEIQEYIANGGVVEPEFTEEELAKQELDKQIAEAKAYLTDTGWIWEKYNRNVLALKDMTEEEFVTKYQEIIDNQEFARSEIVRLEQLIYIDDK